MSLSMYQASIPVFIRMLGHLNDILAKGEAHATAKKIDPSVFINARLAPDMFALARQIQITTDGVKGCAARLAGIDIPRYEDTETTFSELYARINKTIDFLKTVTAQQIDGTEEKQIKLKVGPRELEFKGQAYLLNFVIPNFYFHLVTTYGILRHNGVDIGKMDFLGKE
ncbi:MAG: DUF1993 domain-containing protein [Alphaproteobacteria bacterium]|nr:DUF1993 domain-containing protein [Alphaproteobacteria bacterium]